MNERRFYSDWSPVAAALFFGLLLAGLLVGGFWALGAGGATANNFIEPRVVTRVVTETVITEPVTVTLVVTKTVEVVTTVEVTKFITVSLTATPTPEGLGKSPSGLQLFDYVPGGESFGGWATDVTPPAGYADGECGRVWQATNLEMVPWTSIFCNWQTSLEAPKLQWPHPTQLTVTGQGTVSFELWRDTAAGTGPYEMANVKNSPLGLAWFVQGHNSTVCVNGECKTLDGGGVYQIPFPVDLDGFYAVQLSVEDGQVQFWLGEKITEPDNWPVP